MRGGRADQRELGQVERDDARAGALPHGDRQLAVLHRGIEGLLERARAAGGSRRRRRRCAARARSGSWRRRPCARAPGRRWARSPTPSSLATICASEVLPRPGGPASSTWSSASPRARAASMKIASCSLTRSWPTKSSSRLRAQRAVELVLGRRARSGRGSARRPGVRMPPLTGAALSALGDQVLGRARRADSVEQRVRLLRREAEAEQALARERARVVGRACGARRSRRSPCRPPSRAARR